ncbi:MAG: porin family protein [Hyphomicrobiales bacterium]|jgi:outer membrane immunogenic protein|nr:porin family protein [Hyphomicrobiales bacterium]MBV9907064.1 porin family protein [Hyphomicrobiales bacterium]
MMNRWLKGVAIAALTALGTVAAQAADLPTRKEAPAPVFVPPPFTWTGFYVGVNAGGLWPSGSRNASIFDPNPAHGGFLSADFPGGLGSQSAGFIGGGQAGYNWQTGAFVLGVETDFDGTTNSKSFNNVGTPFLGAGVPAVLSGDFLSVNGKASLSWLGTTRARLGFVATPDNRLMIYATGGVAYGGGSANFSAFDSTHGAFWTGNPSSSRVGWTIGGGVEYAVTNNITIKGEYLYADLGSTSFTSAGNAAVATFFPGVVVSGKIDYNASIFRAGINYKF